MEQKKSLLARPVDLLLSLLLLAAMAFSVFRGIVSKTTWKLLCLSSMIAETWGHMCSVCAITPPAVLQVVLDCPLDTCFTYIYQYEPYLKDPVGFPRVMVSVENDARWIKSYILYILHQNDNSSSVHHHCRYWCICSMLCPCWLSSSMVWKHLDAAGCWTGPSSLQGPWLRYLWLFWLWLLIFLEKSK